MSPGPDSPPGPQPPPGDPPPSQAGAPGPTTPSEPRSDGPEPVADEAPRRSRSARRRARRRAARRAREAGTAGAPTATAAGDASGAPAPPAASTPGPDAARSGRTGGRPAAGTRAASPGRATSGGRGGNRLDRKPDPATAARNRGRRGALRQVEEFSAGGLVLDLNGENPRGALIGRTDRQGRLLWSLPKGHIEAGETAEQAAVREVEEETGIAGTILGELGTIDFWFVADGRRIHKTVRHYLMRRVAGELSDADIEVDEVAWVPFSEIRDQLAYPDERGLVDTAGRMLADSA